MRKAKGLSKQRQELGSKIKEQMIAVYEDNVLSFHVTNKQLLDITTSQFKTKLEELASKITLLCELYNDHLAKFVFKNDKKQAITLEAIEFEIDENIELFNSLIIKKIG